MTSHRTVQYNKEHMESVIDGSGYPHFCAPAKVGLAGQITI